MKKITALLSTLGFLANTTIANAIETIDINQPSGQGGVQADTKLSVILNNVVIIIFTIAILAVLFMLIIGAFQWITSGGDKEAVGKARGRITHALIGLAILALAFLIVTVAGQILDINVLSGLKLPSLTGK